MNTPSTEAGRHAVRCLEETLPKILKPRGIWPLPIAVVTADSGALVKGLELRDRHAYDAFVRTCKMGDVHAAMIGIDRFADGPTQHLTMPSVLTCVLYEKPFATVVHRNTLRLEQFRFGIVEYDAPIRKIKPINWHNAYWKEQLSDEIWEAMMPKPASPVVM